MFHRPLRVVHGGFGPGNDTEMTGVKWTSEGRAFHIEVKYITPLDKTEKKIMRGWDRVFVFWAWYSMWLASR